MLPDDRQAQIDRQQLDVLAKVYRWAGYLATIPIAVALLAAMVGMGIAGSRHGVGLAWGEMLVLGTIGTVWVLALAVAIWAIFRTSEYLRRRERYGFCFVTAVVVGALTAPAGLALAIPTFILLLRPSIRELFTEDSPRVTPQVASTSVVPSSPRV